MTERVLSLVMVRGGLALGDSRAEASISCA